ncbi:HEAT repeat domain-containing protein [Nitrosopumilus sp. S4]
MPVQLIDENNVRKMPNLERFAYCENTLKNDPDESKRWDAVWLVGEMMEERELNDAMKQKIADLLEWTLRNDQNGVVKHEASFQIAARNLRDKIPVLVDISLNDDSILSKHEAIEALGLMRAFEVKELIKESLNDPSRDVRETAQFVLKRFARLENSGEYKPLGIL